MDTHIEFMRRHRVPQYIPIIELAQQRHQEVWQRMVDGDLTIREGQDMWAAAVAQREWQGAQIDAQRLARAEQTRNFLQVLFAAAAGVNAVNQQHRQAQPQYTSPPPQMPQTTNCRWMGPNLQCTTQ